MYFFLLSGLNATFVSTSSSSDQDSYSASSSSQTPFCISTFFFGYVRQNMDPSGQTITSFFLNDHAYIKKALLEPKHNELMRYHIIKIIENIYLTENIDTYVKYHKLLFLIARFVTSHRNLFITNEDLSKYLNDIMKFDKEMHSVLNSVKYSDVSDAALFFYEHRHNHHRNDSYAGF